MTHRLQASWQDEAAEAAYAAEISALIEAGDLDTAQDRLAADLSELATPLAGQALALKGRVLLDGWDEMVEIFAAYEGAPVTALHFMLSNAADLSFEDKFAVFAPDLEIALYSDEFFPFSQSDRSTVLAESLLPDRPWWGVGEDVEVFLELIGLDDLNTALLRHKRQYHFRDQQHELDRLQGANPDIVPAAYIEFRLCAMWRAVLYHQAVRACVEANGLPGCMPVLVGMAGMKFDAQSVYMPTLSKAVEVKPVAELTIKIKRDVIPLPEKVEATAIRRTVQESDSAAERPGFFRRLFSWRRAA